MATVVVPTHDVHLFFGEDKKAWEGCEEFVGVLFDTEIMQYISQTDRMDFNDKFYGVKPPAFQYILKKELLDRASIE